MSTNQETLYSLMEGDWMIVALGVDLASQAGPVRWLVELWGSCLHASSAFLSAEEAVQEYQLVYGEDPLPGIEMGSLTTEEIVAKYRESQARARANANSPERISEGINLLVDPPVHWQIERFGRSLRKNAEFIYGQDAVIMCRTLGGTEIQREDTPNWMSTQEILDKYRRGFDSIELLPNGPCIARRLTPG